MTAYGAGMEILSGMTDDQRCRVLDVGCGKGEWLEEMASRFKQPTYTGIDILPRPVVLPTVVHYVQADRTALPLPFPNNHFLFVHCRKLFSSLEGEDVYPMLLSECVRVLAPGGMIAFIEGRNAQTIQSNSGRPVDRLKEVMIEKLRKDMLIRKGLDTADLLMSLPKLMRDTGLGRIQVESLRPVKRNENIQRLTVDDSFGALAYDLDGNSQDASATDLTVFSGWKQNQAASPEILKREPIN